MHPVLYYGYDRLQLRIMQFMRMALSVVLLVFIWQHLPAQQLFVSLQAVTNNWLLGIAVVLLPLNYYLEAAKWRALLPHSIRPKPGQALAAVLVGQASGFLTPNRLGDYAGRALWFSKSTRLQATGATFSSRLAQLPATLAGGVLASLPVIFSVEASPNWLLMASGLTTAGLVTALLLLPAFSRSSLALGRRFMRRFLPKQLGQFERLKPYSRAQLTRLLALSGLRYMVFTAQYSLLIIWLFPEIELLTAMQLPALVFAAKTFIPSFAFAELGIRESLAVAVAVLLGVSGQIAFEATLVIFILNVLVPAVAGCVIMLTGSLRSKIMTAQNA